MRVIPQRLQTWAEGRLPALTRYRRPESLPVELHRRRIYIVPTAFGFSFTVLLLVMLVGALNYANNSALLLTCLLGAACATSMLVAFRTLDGLKLTGIRAGNAIAGQPIELALEFESQRRRNAIRVDVAQLSTAFSIEPGVGFALKLSLPTVQRGWMTVPRMRVWSSWPLGMFRAWSWLRPEQAVLVWPRAEAAGPAPVADAEDARQMRLNQGDELASLREYRLGDPQHHVAWKASARHVNLLVKDFEQPQQHPQWQLDWRRLAGMDNEARIARLARWVEEARAQQRYCSLWLPGTHIARGSGSLHYVRCMNALAQLP